MKQTEGLRGEGGGGVAYSSLGQLWLIHFLRGINTYTPPQDHEHDMAMVIILKWGGARSGRTVLLEVGGRFIWAIDQAFHWWWLIFYFSPQGIPLLSPKIGTLTQKIYAEGNVFID